MQRKEIADNIIHTLGTFGELDGRRIEFGDSLSRPFKRCLNLQARLARNSALNRGWINQEYDFKDFWSEGLPLTEKIDMFLNPEYCSQ